MSEGWYEGIASRAGVTVKEADAVLRKRGIRAKAGVGKPRALRIASVSFSGEKRGRFSGRFHFLWTGLGDGVWAVASEGRNLVGKSTVLEVALASLRGDIRRIQSDIRKWIEHARVEFTLDGQRHEVDYSLHRTVPKGALRRERPDGVTEEIDTFESAAAFGLVMARFMMEALDLEAVPYQHGKDETAQLVEHGWQALAMGMYFGGNHDVLLGQTTFGGLPARILQLYVGMPWAATVSQASATLKQLATEELRTKAVREEARTRRAEARESHERRLEAARGRLGELPGENAYVEDIDSLAEAVARTTGELIELERSLTAIEDEAGSLRSVADADEREVRDIRESIVATAFFNGLQPTCCPRCEARVTKVRIEREKSEFECSICAEPISAERMEDVDEALREAEARVAATTTASLRAESLLPALRADVQLARQRAVDARVALGAAPTSDILRERRELELEVARLEGMIAALADEGDEEVTSPDRSVVQAAHDLSKEAMDAAAGGLFAALNEEIVSLARQFGFVALDEADLQPTGRLDVKKGDDPTTFVSVTKGERLRLRLATAIALLKVGRRMGVGRHPGLLIIDSPGAEETYDADLETLLRELRLLADGDLGMQVIVSSAKANEVVPALGAGRCRVAREGEYLW
ncbi:hypothetical protein B2G69_18130 [Methylorubrum zatmanii]|nr:hypothetical protein [Methylorubrum zatmanii]ARO55864.1 hypothetical protein B2G69_18130 [Methylorubrum zatmanii]